MNNKFIKRSLFVLSFLIVGSGIAQQKLTKLSQSIKVDKNAILNLNTSNCNVEFDTWSKSVVEIEAYIEGEKLSKEELEKALKEWGVAVNATSKEVSIISLQNQPVIWAPRGGGHLDDVSVLLDELKHSLSNIPELKVLSNIPALPPLPEGITEMQFDYGAYKKDGEKYIEQWSKKIESKFGDEYAEEMEAWGEKLGEKLAKQLESWGENVAAQIESKTEHWERQEKLANERRNEVEKIINNGTKSNAKKTIKIKLPKDVKIKVDVKHGELKFASNVDNLNANLSYTKFMANSINGSETSINASYSPVNITYWNVGELNLNFVKSAEMKHVNRLVLTSNSSNVKIGNLTDNAIIDGNIGDLRILKVGDDFTSLNVNLQNADAIISLPKVDYNLQYKGTRSRLKHPKKGSSENVSTFSTNNSNTNKTIVVNAKYSNVVMQ